MDPAIGVGTVAVALMVVAMLMAGSMVICFCLGVPAVGRMVRPYAVDQIGKVDASVVGIEQALTKKDWDAMKEPAERSVSGVGSHHENVARCPHLGGP